MPKGVYEKNYLYRKTEKLREGTALLRAHDRDFKLQPLMTNDDVYEKLHELGFRYADGMWYKLKNVNGYSHEPTPVQTELPTPKVPQFESIEVILDEGDFGQGENLINEAQRVIDAMQTLGFKVEVIITGTKG